MPKPIFEIRKEQGIYHLYGDKLGDPKFKTWLYSSKFENKVRDHMELLEMWWAKERKKDD